MGYFSFRFNFAKLCDIFSKTMMFWSLLYAYIYWSYRRLSTAKLKLRLHRQLDMLSRASIWNPWNQKVVKIRFRTLESPDWKGLAWAFGFVMDMSGHAWKQHVWMHLQNVWKCFGTQTNGQNLVDTCLDMFKSVKACLVYGWKMHRHCPDYGCIG